MGKADEKATGFLSKEAIFAEVFNNGMFEGRKVIEPEKLADLDSASRHRNLRNKVRDVVKRYNDDMICMILGVENQQHIHFAMPLRIMDYDLRSYEKQRQEIQAKHKEEKDLKGDEYLGGFSKTDRLFPVCTLVLYWGQKPWSGPRDLHDMLEIPEELKGYLDLISNYKMNLLEISKIENLDLYGDELKRVFGFVKYQGDRDALLDFIQRNDKLFREVSLEAYHTIVDLTNSKELENCVETEGEGGPIDMCEALKQLKEDGIQEGLKLGIERGREQGLERGQEQLANLIQILLEENRQEDLLRMTKDGEYREALLRQYALK